IPLNGTEYLLVENRQRDPDGDGMCGVDEHDFGLPGSGILIWHIDKTRLGTYVSSNMVNVDPDHKGVDLEEADGIQDFDYSLPDIYGYEGSSFDPWFQGGYAWEFSPSSEPSSDASWGGKTFVTVEVLDEIQLEMDVNVSRTTVCEGWPIRSSALKWGPVIWSDPDGQGDRLVITTSTGFTLAYGSDGSGPEPMGGGTTAPTVTGNLSEGSDLLLICDDQGLVNLKDPQWNQPDGWPVTLQGGGNGTASLICEQLGFITVADDRERVHMLDAQGNEMDGWPVSVQAPVVGIAVYADENEPGIVAATMDGRLYLWNTAGKPVDGWPVEPGDEAMGIPLTADVDRDGSVEVVALSGDEVFVYDSQGDLLPGFPAHLPARPLSSPSFADIDHDGILETVVITDMGVSAVGPSGATLEDWPAEIEQDSITAAFDPYSRGIGGSGFAMVSLGDGRICMLDSDGSQSGIFPVSAGDYPLGRPVLWDPEGNGSWRAAAADLDGNMYCWNTSFQPTEWFTGMDMSGSNCWWAEDLPDRNVSTAPLRDGSFYVYPNPVQEGVGTIRFQPGRDCSWEIRVFNMGGDLVTFKTGSAPGGSAWEETWNTENLSPGVYFVNLRIISNQGTEDALFHAAVIN
ncbi:MAG: T9SS type A sorting domain-containing protein, partial [Candidatus Aegiribacteria sp.]|nr:T9SS type A sorting domain-containing protein [Candidatus Aegiribacteria sp.]MBD3295123.1 T9SS type A sorting domain-containing protein [Candidatus Fermentibacteria bacterium]